MPRRCCCAIFAITPYDGYYAADVTFCHYAAITFSTDAEYAAAAISPLRHAADIATLIHAEDALPLRYGAITLADYYYLRHYYDIVYAIIGLRHIDDIVAVADNAAAVDIDTLLRHYASRFSLFRLSLLQHSLCHFVATLFSRLFSLLLKTFYVTPHYYSMLYYAIITR